MAKSKDVAADPVVLPPIVTPLLDALEQAGLPKQKAIDFLKGAIARWGLGPELESVVDVFINQNLTSGVIGALRNLAVQEIMELARRGVSDVPASDPVNLA